MSMGSHSTPTRCMEGRKDAKVRQNESYHSTGDLPALNTSCHTSFAPGYAPCSGFTSEHPGFAPCRVIAMYIKYIMVTVTSKLENLVSSSKRDLCWSYPPSLLLENGTGKAE